MEATIEAARGSTQFRVGAVAVVVGIVLGVIARDLPLAVATLAVRADQARPCDDGAVECALTAMPEAIGGLVVFGAVLLVVAVVLATAGVLLLVQGLRRSPATTTSERDPEVPPVASLLVRFVQTMVGTALIVPAVWVVAMFASSQ